MRRLLRSRAGLTGVAAAAGTVVGVVAVVVIARSVDGGALADAWRSARSDHVGVLACAAALLAAFTARAVAWKRILPAISVGQSLAAIHLAMGANHVLPVRLGEPLRVVSVVRRSGVSVPAATASALTLRAADVLTLVGIGVVLAPGAFVGLLGAWGWA
ncbi:MAG: flippase-like domain-containing protein, partial [Acidimicrobiales bacterium]|nr:flippase-like domain-containing protein [Acidimicrobiales bacterium]